MALTKLTHQDLLRSLQSDKQESESSLSTQLKEKAISFLESRNTASPEIGFDLLNQTIKPLFSTIKHAALTSSGRKTLVPPLPSAGRFSTGMFDDESKPWKNDWIVDVLEYVLAYYSNAPVPTGKDTLEAQFHLLIPPILNMIDDTDIVFKTDGCYLLRLLCEAISSNHSEVLKRTGLTDVFVSALRANFMLLPTLTPETESLLLLEQLYPAFRALIAARYLLQGESPSSNVNSQPASQKATNKRQPSSSSSALTASSTIDRDSRQALLDILMRHGILASYSHASENIRIATFLLTEASHIVSAMGIYSVKYLQRILPLLRNVLSNPFGTASPELLLSGLSLMKRLVEVCWPRIKQAWWSECLRGCVGCWMVLSEDDVAVDKERLIDLKTKLQELVALIEVVVGEEFSGAKTRLVTQEHDLANLFKLTQNDEGNS